MRVFISYSATDLDLVEHLAEALDEDTEVDYWDISRELGEPDWEQIEEWIEDADMVLVLITDRTVERAMAVGQEVGLARNLGKPIIPLVAKGVKRTDLGFLGSTTYRSFAAGEFESAVEEVVEVVEEFGRKQNRNGLLALGGLAALGLALSRRRQNPPGGQVL